MMLQSDDIIPDCALAAGDTDRFDHEAIAGRIAELACGAQPPINIALFGPWGSGKSSIYAPMRARIKTCLPDAEVVRYDAWQYGGHALKRNFIDSIADELEESGSRRYKRRAPEDDLTKSTERYSLQLWRWLWTNKGSLGLGFGLAVLVAVLWLLGTSLAAMLTTSGVGWWPAVNAKVSGAGTVLGVLLAAALFGPKALESATVKITQAAPQSDDEFARHFDALVEQVAGKKREGRLVVFIDELDRCSPADVVATLINLKTFLDRPGCVFVVAADREVLESALRVAVPQAKPVREEEPYYSTPGAFLDKIFQHQIALPPLRTTALTRFARSLVIEKQGLWRDLRDRGPGTRTFDDVIYALVPAHVRSPRRVKVLLNNYATLCRIAQARGFDWLARASEIAMLTALRTEFPAFADDLLKRPRLIDQMLDFDGVDAPTDDHIVSKYRVGASTTDGPTGGLLADQDSAEQAGRAENLLKRQLHAYLKKAAAGHAPRPRLDLLYLQRAGQDEGLEDPDLAEIIDYASDTAPQSVIDAFVGREPGEVRTAARLLAERSNAEFGRGQINLVASACGLVEHLDHEEVRPIAAPVASSALVIARNGDLHPDSYSGALTAAALADNEELVEMIVSQLVDDDAEVPLRVLTNCASSLRLLPRQQAERLELALVAKYDEHPDLVHAGLRRLPADAAQQLWSTAEPTIRHVLSALHEASTVVESAPAPARAVRSATAPAQPTPAEPPAESASERYEDLLDALDGRLEPSPALLSSALLMGQTLDIAGIANIARERSEDLLAHIGDPAIVNEHALVGLAANRPKDWSYWASRVDPASSVTDERAAAALQTLVRGLAYAPTSYAQGIPAITETVLQVLPDADDHRRTNLLFGDNENLVGFVLEHIGWNGDEAATRRTLTYDTVSRISRLLRAAIDRVLADDVLTGLGQVTDEQSYERVRQAITQMPQGAVAALAEGLDAYDAPVEAVHLLRMRMAVRSRVEAPPIVAKEILALEVDRAAAKTLISEWLSLNPSPSDVLELVPVLASPSEGALRAYSRGLRVADRTTLWSGLESAEVSIQLLSAVAEAPGGLGVEAVRHVHQRIQGETQQPNRTALAKRLQSVPLRGAQMQSAACDLALYLLGTQRQGDASSAAAIVLHAGGAAHGYTTKLRTALQAAQDRSDKTFSKSQKEALADHNLLRRPKKKGLDRFLNW